MADDPLERAVRAFQNARAAGDEEAARQIAKTIKGMQQQGQMPPERVPIGNLGGMAASATQGFLFGAGDEYMAGLSAILGVQPDGGGGADWFQYDRPFKERYGRALTAIRSEMDEYREENPVKSIGAQVAGGVGGAVTAAATAPVRGIPAAQTALGRAGQMAAGGAAGGALEGFNSGEGGAVSRLKTGAVGAVVGGTFAPIAGYGTAKLGQVASRLYDKSVGRLFTNRAFFDPATGELTDRGQQRLAQLGYDARAVSQEMQRALGEAAERIDGSDVTDAAAVGRLAAAQRFGVPVTRGQATGDVAQTAAEEGMRAGVRGQAAANIVGSFDTVQRDAVETARAGLGANLGNAQGRIDAAESVIAGVRREAGAAQSAGRAAYETLEQSGAGLRPDAAASLRRSIELAVRNEGVPIDEATPNARAALSVIDSAFQSDNGGAIPFTSIERARQRLVGFRRAAQSGSNGADQVAIENVVREFDGWLDDAITNALVSGDDTVLAQAKEARGLWAKYRSTFLGRDGADNFIRKIVEDDLAPDQVAGWLFGASRNIGGGQTSLVARRVKGILGEDSAEWGAVRRAAWDHITTATDGRDAFGPQRVASNISELLSGKGQTLGRELFTERELRAMGEFRDMLTVLVPPRKATNPSGSGYEVQRGMQLMMQGMAGLVGTTAGGPLAGAATSAAASGGSNFSGTLAARAAAQGITIRPPSVPAAVGAGVAMGGAAQDSVYDRDR